MFRNEVQLCERGEWEQLVELKKQYKVSNRDREEALQVLSSAQRKPEETAQYFSFWIRKMVKLAYLSFNQASRLVHEKDVYIRSRYTCNAENFTRLDMKGIVDHTVRLKVAGVKSATKPLKDEINTVQNSDIPRVPKIL